MMDEAGVDRAVIVPPSWEGDRNDCVIETVRRYPRRFAIMGRIPDNDPNVAKLLPDWKKQPGMAGIRLTFHPPQWRWLSDGSVEWFWPLAEKYGVPVMFYGAPMQHFAKVGEWHPQLAMIADQKLTEGVKETAALAKYPNVSVKLSTTPFYSSESYPFRDMAEHIRRLSMPMGRAGAIGQPTSRIPSTRRRTGNASRISPRRWIFSRTKTKSGSWAALSWRD